MATNTKNLNLKKPAQEDFYNVDDFNQNFQKLDDFAGRKDNPHGVTAEQVGLGEVPNVATNDQTPTFTPTTDNQELVSGEKLGVSFGKIATIIKNAIRHFSNTNNPHNLNINTLKKTQGVFCIENGGTGASNAATATQNLLFRGTINANNPLDADTLLDTGIYAIEFEYNYDYESLNYPEYEGVLVVETAGRYTSQVFYTRATAVNGISRDNAIFQRAYLTQYFKGRWSRQLTPKDPICFTEYGSYVGTGHGGADKPNTLNFDFEPQLVWLYNTLGTPQLIIMPRGVVDINPVNNGVSSSEIHITWGDNDVSWYSDYGGTDDKPVSQWNISGITYYYGAIG